MMVMPGPARAQDAPSAAQVLERSIAYHDPGGHWATHRHRFTLREERPNGHDRQTVVETAPGTGDFTLHTEREAGTVEARLIGDACTATLDGTEDIPDDLRTRYRLSCEGIGFWRDYYGYLFGLPMKLRDPGTRLDPAAPSTTFEGRAVLALRVVYDADVGADTWYFYVDPTTYALVGARFYHDEAANDGEYLVFEGEIAGDGLRWPKARRWYMNADGQYLGADVIEVYERVE